MWRQHYNTVRPHSSLDYKPPAPAAVLPLASQNLNLSNRQIAAELDLAESVVQEMTAQLREGVVVKKASLLDRRG